MTHRLVGKMLSLGDGRGGIQRARNGRNYKLVKEHRNKDEVQRFKKNIEG